MRESFTIEPVDTMFDVGALDGYADTLPFGTRDGVIPCVVMLADSAASVEMAMERRADDASRFPYSVTLLQIEPHRVLVTPGPEGTATAKHFVQWLAERYTLRFRDGQWRDVTEQARQNLELLFVGE